jgi:peroxiredoxin
MEGTVRTGELAPEFSAPDLAGKVHTLASYRGRVLVINFWSAECPWSERADGLVVPALARLEEGIALLSIASNANEAVEDISAEAARRGVSPLLMDRDQAIADRYNAQATPHYFVIDGGGVLRFQGPPDDATFRQRQPARDYLLPAVRAVLAGEQPDPDTILPFGCAIVRFTIE